MFIFNRAYDNYLTQISPSIFNCFEKINYLQNKYFPDLTKL